MKILIGAALNTVGGALITHSKQAIKTGKYARELKSTSYHNN